MTASAHSIPRIDIGVATTALFAVLACALIWGTLPAVLLLAPYGDNVEQLNWSHALQWGYFKHPPLPTWLLWAAIDVFGPSAVLTYALAMACVALALALLWLAARQVLEPRLALIALLVSTANYYLMGRGSLLNHNTVMLPFVALSAWAVLKIVRGAGWPMWLVLGLAQAFGLLTKYQMGLVVIANMAALLAAGVHRQPRFARHLALAAGATLLPLAPHVWWLYDHHFTTFQYAGENLLADLGPLGRLEVCIGFLAQQAVRLAPAVLALALTRWVAAAMGPGSAAPVQDAPAATPNDAAAMRALAVLALLPIAGIVLMTLVGGVAAQNHWGASTTLLIPLLLLSRMRVIGARPVLAAAAATALCHIGAIAWNVAVWKIDPAPANRFAARSLAALAQRHWSTHEHGSIRFVLGPDWEAGSIALYLPGHPEVLPNTGSRIAPWRMREEISRCGALVIGRPDQPLTPQIKVLQAEAARATDLTLLEAHDALGRESEVQAALIAPSAGRGCL
jgi:hypothetical protein